MLFRPHLVVWVLALSLISSSPAVSLTQSPQSSDEEAMRVLTERYGKAISGDLDIGNPNQEPHQVD